MPQVLSTIAGGLSKAAPILSKAAPIVTGGMGLLSNIHQGQQQGKVQNVAVQNQQMLAELAKNPALLAQRIQQLTQPLSQGLVKSVGNNVQGELAERGLAMSPNIYGDVFAQSLAPFQQQEEQRALEALMTTLGLGNQATATATGTLPPASMTDTSGMWQKLMEMFPQRNPFGVSSTRNIPTAGPDVTGTQIPSITLPEMGSGGTQFPGTDIYSGAEF